jgi:glycosyltransferase involved in cell wall biosynthesis
MTKRLKIAIIGSRGIPGNYGGFETFADHLSVGLVERGHSITVYCASGYSTTDDREYRGVRRVLIPTIRSKSIEKLSNAFLSCLHAAFQSYDLILFLGVSPVPFSWMGRVAGKRLVINIDGLEWKRQKWNRFASKFLETCEALSGVMCHEVVTDAKALQEYYRKRYGRESTFIAYGADIGRHEDDGTLNKFGLEAGKYLLQVGRMEPENNAHLIIEEYKQVDTDYPLVVLGDAPHSDEYKKKLKAAADPRVKFLGAIYGNGYNVIRSNPYLYIHGHEVGGTNPALLEALAAGNCVAVLNVAYNLEVIGEAGFTFSKESGSLSSVIQELLLSPEIVADYRIKAVDRIKEHYTWDSIISEYEKLFLSYFK